MPTPSRLELENTIARLSGLLDAQQSQIDELRKRLDREAHRPTPVGRGEPRSRRALLTSAGVAGAAAAGAGVAAALGSSPAAAADGDPLTIGQLNDGQSATILESTGIDSDTFLSRDGPIVPSAGVTEYRSAVGGHAVGNVLFNGVHAFASDDSAPSADLTTGHPLIAQAGPNARSSILLTPTGPDPSRVLTVAHGPGELISDDVGNLWYCVAAGTPGAFRKLAGTDTAGSFIPIDPIRVHDTRFEADGPIQSGTDRVVPTRDARNVDDYAVLVADAIPPATFAIAFNLTIVNTTGRGFLTVAPANQTTIQASTINWGEDAAGPVANAGQVKVEADRQVRVFCGPGGSCDFIIDVVGYYR